MEQQGSYYTGGLIQGVWFVLSGNADCSAYLRQLDNGTLRSPVVVKTDSPEAKRWLEMNSSKGPGAENRESGAESGNASD